MDNWLYLILVCLGSHQFFLVSENEVDLNRIQSHQEEDDVIDMILKHVHYLNYWISDRSPFFFKQYYDFRAQTKILMALQIYYAKMQQHFICSLRDLEKNVCPDLHDKLYS